MRSYRYLHFDVFTDRLFGGNQLAVVLDGRGLTDSTMQAIANEMNFSETTFVLPAEHADTDMRVRIFTPAEELPMAGHPTIGTVFALARAGVVGPGHDRVTLGLGVGPIAVALTWSGEELAFAWMTQLNPTVGLAIIDRAGAAASLRVPERALAANLPIQAISCGLSYVLVPIRSRADVDRASLDATAYARFKSQHNLDGDACVYLFSTESTADGATAYARMFAPSLGIGEDPATGSAAGPLGCYLVLHQLAGPETMGRMLVRQGVKMGRPSDIRVAIGVTAAQISSVRVGGSAVLAGEGTLYV